MSERSKPELANSIADNRRELHREKIGLRDYVITDEEREVIEQWKAQIHEFHDAIQQRDLELLVELMKGKNFLALTDETQKQKAHKKLDEYVRNIFATLEAEGLDEEGKTLLAIALWVIREQDKWRKWRALAKTITGGEFSLSSFLRYQGKPNCLDSAILVRRMAEDFGITGDIKLNKENRFSHRYFESEAGNILDIWWGWKRGGLFQDEHVYEERKEEMKHLCGTS